MQRDVEQSDRSFEIRRPLINEFRREGCELRIDKIQILRNQIQMYWRKIILYSREIIEKALEHSSKIKKSYFFQI